MISKLLNLRKLAVVVLFSIVAFIGFSAFKNAGSTSVKPKALVDVWFTLDVSGTTSPEKPADQKITAQLTGSPTAPCIETTGTYCSTELQYDNADAAISALIARIGTSNPPTVDEFINAGATVNGYSFRP